MKGGYMRTARQATRREFHGQRPCAVGGCGRQAHRMIARLALCHTCARNLERNLGTGAVGVLDGTERLARGDLLRLATVKRG